MRTKKNKRSMHSAMKNTRTPGSPGFRRAIKIALVLLALTAIFAIYKVCAFAVSKLRDCWESQCVITDIAAQVSISATPHVKAEHVQEWFCLSNGCNLARLDLAATRERVLKEHPIVKDMSVRRHLPNRIEIAVEERIPIARVNRRRVGEINRWDVVDVDGMVFEYARKDSKKLPVIVEKNPSAQRGERLSGRALTALRLVELCSLRSVASLPECEISTDSPTYLKVTTENYSTVLIAWNLLDDASDPAQPALTQILTNLRQLMNKGLYPDRVTYTITDLDRIAVRTYD